MPYPKIDPKLRFNQRYIKSANGCWLWTAAKDYDGYGTLQIAKNSTRKAHRLAYEWYRGEIPDGLNVLHLCDTPSCVNPSHLFLGTHSDNMKDSAAKGRKSGIYNANSNYRRAHGRTIPEAKLPTGPNGSGAPLPGNVPPTPGGGAGLLPQSGGNGANGRPLGVEAPGVGRVDVQS